MVFRVVFLLVLIALCDAQTIRDKYPKIVNGTDADISEAPFLVSLQYILSPTEIFHTCGGSILNQEWILTAAHCIEDEFPESYLVEYATTEISNGHGHGEKIAYVDQLIWHEEYDNEELRHDIGLVRVKTPLESDLYDLYARLPIRGQYFSTGTPTVLFGWGQLGTGLESTTILQKVNLQFYSRYDCAKLHNPGWILTNNICAGVPDGYQGQCNGDSGGPLIVNGVVVGIVSWSIKPCTVPPYPGVFTAVSPYIDWIEERSGVELELNMFMRSSDA